ncbi:MAG: tetratricopeptide repeat protein [Planctomycetota bacterium]
MNLKQTVAVALTAFIVVVVGCASATERLARGDGHFAAGRYSQALEQYESARHKDPALHGIDNKIHNAQVLVHLDSGDRALEAQRWADAEAAYRRVGLLSPDHPGLARRFESLALARANFHFVKGQRYLTDGNPFEAILQLEQALSYHPEHPRASTALEEAQHEKKNRTYRADEVFESGKRARSDGQFDAAIEHFATALELNPYHQHAARLLQETREHRSAALLEAGDLLLESGDYEQALTQYRLALRGREHLPEAQDRIRWAEFEIQAREHADRAQHAFDRGDWQAAFDQYSSAVRITRKPQRYAERHSQAALALATQLYERGVTAEEVGDYATAIEEYKSVVSVDPQFRDASLRCQQLVRNLPIAESGYNAGCQAENACDIVAAEKNFRRCVDAIPEYRDAHERLHSARARLSRAEDFFDRAVRAQNQANYAKAIILFEECLTIASPYRDIARRLKHVRAAQKRLQESAPEPAPPTPAPHQH